MISIWIQIWFTLINKIKINQYNKHRNYQKNQNHRNKIKIIINVIAKFVNKLNKLMKGVKNFRRMRVFHNLWSFLIKVFNLKIHKMILLEEFFKKNYCHQFTNKEIQIWNKLNNFSNVINNLINLILFNVRQAVAIVFY